MSRPTANYLVLYLFFHNTHVPRVYDIKIAGFNGKSDDHTKTKINN